jgi:hypothetical protein
VLKILDIAIKQEKEIRMTQIEKGQVKLSLFVYMILYLKDPKDSTRRLVGLISTFSKVAVHQIDMKKKTKT